MVRPASAPPAVESTPRRSGLQVCCAGLRLQVGIHSKLQQASTAWEAHMLWQVQVKAPRLQQLHRAAQQPHAAQTHFQMLTNCYEQAAVIYQASPALADCTYVSYAAVACMKHIHICLQQRDCSDSKHQQV